MDWPCADLDLLLFTGQLVAGALNVVQTADLRRAARDQDHAGPQRHGQALKYIIVNDAVFLLDQRHAADLHDQINVLHLMRSPLLLSEHASICGS